MHDYTRKAANNGKLPVIHVLPFRFTPLHYHKTCVYPSSKDGKQNRVDIYTVFGLDYSGLRFNIIKL